MDGVFMNLSPAYQAPKFKVGDIVTNGCQVHIIARAGAQYALGNRQAYEYVGGGWDYEPTVTGLNDVAAVLSAGRKIDAIKLYREKTGVGLKEAKDACETIGALIAKPESKFKVGDRVKLTGLGYVRDTGTVYEVSGERFRARWDNGNGWYTWFNEADATLAKTGSFIVAVFERGKYRPNANPFIHTDEAAAIAEAERLSRKHQGQKFGTFALIADSETPPNVTKTVRA